MKTIDLNCDLGEFEHWIERDVRLCEFVSSINVACGGHAGTPETMRRLCEAGHRLGIRVGAHPSYPDRAGFGRVPMPMEHDALREEMTRQAGQLAAAANAAGVRITHVKPHGALYHDAMGDIDVAMLILDAARGVFGDVMFVAMSGARSIHALVAAGAQVTPEAFADRLYIDARHLVSRNEPGALLDADAACKQARLLATSGEVRTRTGGDANVLCGTICVHSDAATSEFTVVRVSEELRSIGVLL